MSPPERGEVWLVDLGLAAKIRPALILSVQIEETDRALVTLIPHTTSLLLCQQQDSYGAEGQPLYNNTQADHIFLYEPGDLDTAAYWDTFLLMPADRRQDFLKRRRIRRRQRRGRTVSDRGLTREWRGQVKELRYDATPGDLQRELRTMFGRAE